MKIILLSLLAIVVIFLFFYGKAIYKSFVGIHKLVKSEAFQGLINSEGFQNMVKNRDYKNIRSLEGFRNVVKEGFTSGCSSCHKEGFQINISDFTGIDISGAVTNIADQNNIDLSNVDTSQITPTTIVQNINNLPNDTATPTATASERPDINDPNVQCQAHKNQINTFIDLRQKYKDLGDWVNVRRVNASISALQEQINTMGCSN